MSGRDQPQINFLFAATALAVGTSLGVILSHTFWRMDFLLGSRISIQPETRAVENIEIDAKEAEPTLDYLAFREKIRDYDKMDSVLETTRRMAKLFDTVPDKAIPLAVELIDDIETHMAKGRAAEVLFSRWAEFDPAAALDTASSLKMHLARNAALQSVFGVWLEMEPEIAVRSVMEMPHAEQRERALHHCLQQLQKSQPALAGRVLLSSRDVTQIPLHSRLPELGMEWGKLDANAALSWGQSHLDNLEDRAVFVGEVIHGWALQRPETALEFVRGLSINGNASETQELLVEVLRGWAEEDPAAAMQYLYKFEDENERRSLMEPLAPILGAVESERIVNWTKKFEEPERVEILAQVIDYKLRTTPVEAAQLAGHLPDGAIQESVFADLALSWATEDAPAVSVWLTSLPASAARDSAASTFASAILASDPARAMDWAGAISDPSLRTEVLAALMERWMTSDPAAARQWLANQ